MPNREPGAAFLNGRLRESEADVLLDDPLVNAVWAIEQSTGVRRDLFGDDTPEDAVIELVVETDDSFVSYSYTHGPYGTAWVCYGAKPKGSGFETTLESYQLLAGETSTDHG